MAGQRERLVTELQLDDAQQAKLDAISADMRPRFMALADLDQAARPAALLKLMGEMQQKINAMLSPDQRAKYEQMQARAAAARAERSAQGADGSTVPQGGAAAAAPKGAAAAPGRPVASGAGVAAQAAASAGPPAATGAGTGAVGGGSVAAAPAAAPAGGGPLQEFRNRLVTELRLGADQAGKIDGLIAESRPRFMALRDLAAEERPKARDRVLADLRARIGDTLTPEQKTRYTAFLAEASGRTSTRGRIYLLGDDGKPRAFNVRLGISDGSSTELLVTPGTPAAADLREGATVIVGIQSPAAGAARPASGGPRLPF